MRRSVLLGSMIALFAVIVVVTLLATGIVGPTPPTPEPAATSAPVTIGGPFEMVDQDGRTVTDKEFQGKLMLVYFGYTFCPDVCPTSLQVMSAAAAELGDAAEEVALVFVTVDPERDTVEAMKDYVGLFDPPPLGLTGSSEQIKAMTDAYRVYFRIPEEDRGDDYLVDHSSFVYLMGKDGLYAAHFSHDATPEEMVTKIRELLG